MCPLFDVVFPRVCAILTMLHQRFMMTCQVSHASALFSAQIRSLSIDRIVIHFFSIYIHTLGGPSSPSLCLCLQPFNVITSSPFNVITLCDACRRVTCNWPSCGGWTAEDETLGPAGRFNKTRCCSTCWHWRAASWLEGHPGPHWRPPPASTCRARTPRSSGTATA